MQIPLNKNLASAYHKQYENNLADWRAIGAKQKAQNIMDISEGKQFAQVLELGAGDGSILQILAQKKFANSLYALDISESGVKTIQEKNIPSLKETLVFNGYEIPYPDKYFDLLILSHVLEHVEHERILLREIKRVSHYQIIEVPKDYRFGVDKKVKHFLAYGHINLYTPSLLKFLLKSEGFRVLKELNRLYSQEIYLFDKKTYFQKNKARLIYFLKKLLISTPFPQINQHFINTITLFLEAGKEEMEIF